MSDEAQQPVTSDEAQVRAIALEDNRRAARQCRHLATDLRRARSAWRSLVRQLPQDEKGDSQPDALDYLDQGDDVSLALRHGFDQLTGMVDALEDRAAVFDAAAEQVSRAIDRAGEQP